MSEFAAAVLALTTNLGIDVKEAIELLREEKQRAENDKQRAENEKLRAHEKDESEKRIQEVQLQLLLQSSERGEMKMENKTGFEKRNI